MHLKSRGLPIAIGVVALALVAAIVTSVVRDDTGGRAAAEETDPTRSVTVTGEGRVSLTPDTVYLTLGVDISNPDLGAAQSQAASQMEAVIASLKASGVDEKDIQTSNYSIYIDRDYNQPGQPITGYHVTHTVTAKVRDISKAGPTISAAVDAGANTVQNVSFGIEDSAGAIQQARELAVADAQAKAAELARLTDSTLGPVLTISEYSSGGVPVPYMNAMPAADAKGAAPPINAGQTEVVVSVNVSWVLN